MEIREMKYTPNKTIPELLYTDNYFGYNFYVVSLGNYPTAYIEIPETNKYYKKSYHKLEDTIYCHGGLTYSDSYIFGIKDNSWFIGWDYAHAGDYIMFNNNLGDVEGRKYTTEEIIEECKIVICELKVLEK